MQSFANTETNSPFFLRFLIFSLFTGFHPTGNLPQTKQFWKRKSYFHEFVKIAWANREFLHHSSIKSVSPHPVLVCLLNLFHFTYFQVTLSKANLAVVKMLFFLMFLQKNGKNVIHNHVNNIKVKHKVEWRDMFLEKLFSLEFPQWIRAVEMCSHYHK